MTEKEMTDIVYDTLMQNKQHVQLDIDKVDNQEVDSALGIITFTYEDVGFGIVIKRRI